MDSAIPKIDNNNNESALLVCRGGGTGGAIAPPIFASLAGVNICPLFRKFGYGTVLDFWHFSEKFFGKKKYCVCEKWKTFPKFKSL